VPPRTGATLINQRQIADASEKAHHIANITESKKRSFRSGTP
jgi:hypothetical protein